jgi:hypothetical protein
VFHRFGFQFFWYYSPFFEKNTNQTAHFGDVDLTFEVVEY